jgi:hypothetical protein
MERIHDQTLNSKVGMWWKPAKRKAKHPKNGEKKVQDDERPQVLAERRNRQPKADRKGNMNKSSTQTRLQAHIK